MARVRSEGYGAEWIEVPDELLSVIRLYPTCLKGDDLVFVVSRSDTNLECFFAAERGSNEHVTREIVLSTGFDTTSVPGWVSLSGVPQYLFDNLLVPLLKGERSFLTGYIYKPQES